MGRIGGKVHQTASQAIAPTSQRSSDAADVFSSSPRSWSLRYRRANPSTMFAGTEYAALLNCVPSSNFSKDGNCSRV